MDETFDQSDKRKKVDSDALEENQQGYITEEQWEQFLSLKDEYLLYRLIATVISSCLLLAGAIYCTTLVADGDFNEYEMMSCAAFWCVWGFVWLWYVSDWWSFRADMQSPQVEHTIGKIHSLNFKTFEIKLEGRIFHSRDTAFEQGQIYELFYLSNSLFILSASPTEKYKPKRKLNE